MGDGTTAEREQFAVWLALVALAVTTAGMVYLAGRPLATPDLWWHLEMGEVYTREGPWPDGDPMLHTANANAPVQHEWLFGVMVHAVEKVAGFAGLRVFHALLVAGILSLVYGISRREAGSRIAACCATTLFITLSWWRLSQLRPDLVSIPATLAIYALLLQGDGVPSRRRVAASLVLLAVWANMHSLFAVGLALIVAALIGLALRPALTSHLSRRAQRDAASATALPHRRAVRLAVALVLGVIVTALNPRGFRQHLTFFTSSREAAIWFIRDEWLAFDPLHWGHYPAGSVSLTAWIATDAVLIAFLAIALLVASRFWRRPTKAGLRVVDPVHFGVGLAGVVALFVSIRFLWMAIFPILFLLRVLRSESESLPSGGAAIRIGLAAATALLAVLFFGGTGFSHESAAPGAYFSRVVDVPDYYWAGVRFLKQSDVEGNLFNEYPLGGFLGYWLSPRLRTFVDSRTEHYAPEVLYDCFSINKQRGGLEGESFADVLERREVDLFFGSGLPLGHESATSAKRYTTAHLEHVTDWLLVSRSVSHAVYLRMNERNRDNLERIDDYYRREGVPFDRVRGFDPGRVIAERPDWAVAHQMIPLDYERELRQSSDPDPALRFAALDRLAAVLALVGAYEEVLHFERRALALRPSVEAPRRRLVYELLRLDRFTQALDEGRLLVQRRPGSPHAMRFAAAASRYSLQRRQGRPIWPPGDGRPPIDAIVNALPLFDEEEVSYYFAGRYERVPKPR